MEWSRSISISFAAAMCLPHFPSSKFDAWLSRAPLWIAVGLAVLIANALFPVVPVVTAMALVAFGATAATVERFRRTPVASIVVPLNLVVYFSLYALFFGATWHEAAIGPQRHLSAIQAADLAVSMTVLAALLAVSS
jgi:hypothetical protein